MAAAKTTNEKTVTIVVPRIPGGDERYFIALNGKAYNVPIGVPVEVPEEVAAIYYESLAAEEHGNRYSDQQHEAMKHVQGA